MSGDFERSRRRVEGDGSGSNTPVAASVPVHAALIPEAAPTSAYPSTNKNGTDDGCTAQLPHQLLPQPTEPTRMEEWSLGLAGEIEANAAFSVVWREYTRAQHSVWLSLPTVWPRHRLLAGICKRSVHRRLRRPFLRAFGKVSLGAGGPRPLLVQVACASEPLQVSTKMRTGPPEGTHSAPCA
jgi:hypothetical protein